MRISIHALCEEGDTAAAALEEMHGLFLSTPSARRATIGIRIFHGKLAFLSTPSARRATRLKVLAATGAVISIHALCEEGDFLFGGLASGAK